ncbi:MAG: OmpA family protein [Alphaproteobacteria bacterium]|nr:OmpA family protein [Alphaproteobacteria bacterium]
MLRRWLCIVLVALLPATVQGATYTDPDAPETQAAARAALATAKTLDIVGISLGIDALLKDVGARVSDTEIRILLPADVLFDFDKSNIRPDASVALGKVAEILKGYARAPVTVEGHTDGKGSPHYNQALSDRRAGSVKEWLVNKGGIAAARITAKGLGMSRPVAPNTKPDGSDDPAGRQKNRRVEIVVHKR